MGIQATVSPEILSSIILSITLLDHIQLCPFRTKNSFKFWWGIKAGLNDRHDTLTKIINSTSSFCTFESPWEKWSVYTRMDYWLGEDKRGLHLPMINSKDHKKTSFVFKINLVTCTLHISSSDISLWWIFKKKRYSVLFFSKILAVAYFSKILCSKTVQPHIKSTY